MSGHRSRPLGADLADECVDMMPYVAPSQKDELPAVFHVAPETMDEPPDREP